MDRERLFMHISKMEADMNNMHDNLQTLKELAVRLVEENVTLHMEKEKYEKLYEEDETVEEDSFKGNT